MKWGPSLLEETEDEDWGFYGEAIQAWKAWRVIELHGILLLQSLVHRANWIPRQEMVSECMNKSNPNFRPHLSPNIRHGCGIYSVKQQDWALQWQRYPNIEDVVVYGRVSIWGNVFKFTKGYISEYAYPSYLYVPPDKGQELYETIHPEELRVELNNTYVVEVEVT